jgi:hypothetical protein
MAKQRVCWLGGKIPYLHGLIFPILDVVHAVDIVSVAVYVLEMQSSHPPHFI